MSGTRRTRPRRSRAGRAAAVAVAALLTLGATACGAEVGAGDANGDSTAGDPVDTDHYPVTITNCGEELTFRSAPERVLTYDVGITEIMFALGLWDRMVGYAMFPDDRASSTDVEWGEGYERSEWLSEDRISMELILEHEADLVFAGWNYGFSEDRGLTPDTLASHGVDSYLLTESCRSGEGTARGVMPPLEALYTDLEQLGILFDVEERAEELIERFRAEVAATEEAAPTGDDRPRVFLYDDGRDKPLTSGAYAGPHDIITRAGGDHVMADLEDSWVTVGWETVVERDPEVIVINNYGGTTAEEKEAFLKSHPPLAGVSAIVEDRIFVLDYADLVESPRNPAAVTALGEYLREVAGGD
ncbi:ABC transporter substrate-binding protein [Streptomyces calidiresistens]|uniref:ABC transporter substrate-binding protein n=1 Tax=Streptomyces calidiresistens TaxID=1485586 RepID=A0A7W3T4F8_9ACTN|nr:ABC transporter substrate-binding protein [Streptomyces calidiresistens]MBB0230790.1 ABC transporter substrate-binding protein [Streptomyces calidiresistens]